MPGLYLRGALIQMTEAFGATVPNVIIFQYNPETLTHTWSPATQGDGAGVAGTNPLGVTGLPSETFSFTLVMDANDRIGQLDPVAITSGIYSRLAALEMLLFPVSTGDGLASNLASSGDSGGASIDGGAKGSSQSQTVPAGELPFVLFVWGGARVVPVRVQNLSVTETLYDALLNPTHAEATITLQVLTNQDLANASGTLAEIAKHAYGYTHGARQTLALANLGNAVESPIGLVPFL